MVYGVDVFDSGRNQGSIRGHIHENGGARVSRDMPPSDSAMSECGKEAKRFGKAIASYAFNPSVFAYALVQFGGAAMYPRIMEVMKAVIGILARYYDAGEITDATMEAKRIQESIDKFDRERF